MPSGLAALLDDVAALTRLAAASLDDVGAAAGRAGVKAAGVVIDDTAVTPRYVVGLSPARELPIIGRIAAGSMRNKLLILLPAALLLSVFAPWALTPLLMAGGTYLCFEGAEKLWEAFSGHAHAADDAAVAATPELLEKQTVSGAIRTDFILSAEIMAIALGEVADGTLLTRALALALVAVAITAGVYGAVALIVKLDDIGLYLTRKPSPALRALGRSMVRAMPVIMAALSAIGIAAMIWVGGQIIVHGLAQLGLAAPEHLIHDAATAVAGTVPALHGLLEWLVSALGAGIMGLGVGTAVAFLAHAWPRRDAKRG